MPRACTARRTSAASRGRSSWPASSGIDCDLRRKPNLTYTEEPTRRPRIEAEAGAARRAGLPASLVEDTDLPVPVAAAVRFADQAEFHPVKYLEGARARARARGGAARGHVRGGVDAGAPCRVRTDAGRTVTAGRVVVATHLPFLDRGLYFARCHPERSYVVAAPYDAKPPRRRDVPEHRVAGPLDPHPCARRATLAARRRREPQDRAGATPRERYARLEAWARERFGVEPVMRWATQDQMPADGVPYIGPVDPRLEERVRRHRLSQVGPRDGHRAAAELLAA